MMMHMHGAMRRTCLTLIFKGVPFDPDAKTI